MMQESAIALGVELRSLVEEAEGSAGQVIVSSRVGTPADIEEVRALVTGASVLTFEHEHIPASLFETLGHDVVIEPRPEALLYAQDKLAMRARLEELGVPCPRWEKIDTEHDLDAFAARVGFPLVVKTPRGGYDGHGVRVITSVREVADWFTSGPLLAEELVPYTCEVAALCARRPSGDIASWPLARSEQADGVCSVVTAPAQDVSPHTADRAQAISEHIATALGVTGVLAVEFFVVNTDEGECLYVNELAMRPHNTGHWTIDGSVTSQFEQHLRAVLDLPLGSTALRVPGATSVMVNLLASNDTDPVCALPRALAGHSEAKIHLYGKEARPRRKLGHVTVMDRDPQHARREAETVAALLCGEYSSGDEGEGVA